MKKLVNMSVGQVFQVLPYVFISGSKAAEEKEVLSKAGITDVVNLISEEFENAFPGASLSVLLFYLLPLFFLSSQ